MQKNEDIQIQRFYGKESLMEILEIILEQIFLLEDKNNMESHRSK
ncbi:MAG: hypothetical protein AB2421_11185 [Thermotaleaceae bacterium]